MRNHHLVLLVFVLCAACKAKTNSTSSELPDVGPDQLILNFVPTSKDQNNYQCEVVRVRKMGFGVSANLNKGDVIQINSSESLKLNSEVVCLIDAQVSPRGNDYTVIRILNQ